MQEVKIFMENIFSELASVRREYDKRKAEFDTLTGETLVACENYIASLRWCGSSIGRNIYLYQSEGMSTEEICSKLKLNENTFRSMLSRISAHLRKEVFKTNNLFETILFSDSQTRQELINRMKFLMMDYSLFNELDADTVAMLLKSADEICIQDTGGITEGDLAQAIAFVKMLSNDYRLKQLKNIKAGALKMVISGLKTRSYNSFIDNYINTEVPVFISNTNWIQKLLNQYKPMLEKEGT